MVSLLVLGGWLGALTCGGLWWVLALTHPVLLAIQFGVAAWGCRHRPDRESLAGWFRAWWREWGVSMRVFGWQQPWRPQVEPDSAGPAAGGAEHAPARRGVLLVHGYFCNRGLWTGWIGRLQAAGHPVMAVNLEPLWGDIDGHVALLDAAAHRLQAATGQPPLVVAHSMGGLAVRAWLRVVCSTAEKAGAGADAADAAVVRRVAHVITLGTPHHGTWLARLGWGRNAQQMRWHSRWLADLAGAEPPGLARHFTCWHSLADNIVMPAGTAVLPGSRERRLNDVGHVALVTHPAVWSDVQAALLGPLRAP